MVDRLHEQAKADRRDGRDRGNDRGTAARRLRAARARSSQRSRGVFVLHPHRVRFPRSVPHRLRSRSRQRGAAAPCAAVTTMRLAGRRAVLWVFDGGSWLSRALARPPGDRCGGKQRRQNDVSRSRELRACGERGETFGVFDPRAVAARAASFSRSPDRPDQMSSRAASSRVGECRVYMPKTRSHPEAA